MTEIPYRNLGMDLVRTTEAAALAAGRWMGLGTPREADQDATAAMWAAINTIEMDGQIVTGEEGRPLGRAVLRAGAGVGAGSGPLVDAVADPIDGRRLLARGYPGAMSTVAVAPRGAFWSPAPAGYMAKIVVDATVAPYLVPECLDAPAAWTLALIARAKDKRVGDLVALVLDRPRHVDLIQEIRQAGARVMLRTDGDVAGALMAMLPDGGVDVLLGIGGVVQGLIAACAIKATGGAMLGRLAPQSEAERQALDGAGLDTQRILTVDEMVQGDETFFAATGITDGVLLSGVHYHGNRATSNSMILRGKTRTRRMIHAEHLLGSG